MARKKEVAIEQLREVSVGGEGAQKLQRKKSFVVEMGVRSRCNSRSSASRVAGACIAAEPSNEGYVPAAVGGSISILLITLPVAVRGSSSRNVMSRGTQKRLNRFRM